MAAPLFDALQSFHEQESISFHMPGHKKGKGIPKPYRDAFQIDTTELELTDNLHEPTGCILKAQQEAANAVGAKETFFHVNGATGAMLTSLFATCRRGDTILVNQNAHACVLSAAVLLDLKVVFYAEKILHEFQIPQSISPRQIEKAIHKHPEAKVVVLTSPNYYGIGSDVREIARLSHENHMCLLVDEAHGAHLPYCTLLPDSAVTCGADLVIQSAHKTLNAPTQSAFLHRVTDRISHEALCAAMHLFLSSSPSYILMGYMDLARDCACHTGEKGYAHLLHIIAEEEKTLLKKTAYRILREKNTDRLDVFYQDATRIVVNVEAYAVTAKEAEYTLAHTYGIYAEMSDANNLVLIATLANTEEEIHALFAALADMEKGWERREETFSFISKDWIEENERICYPARAYDSPSETIALEQAIGRMAKRTVSIYPPHTPLVVAGEVITEGVVEKIRQAKQNRLSLFGISEDKIDVLVR